MHLENQVLTNKSSLQSIFKINDHLETPFTQYISLEFVIERSYKLTYPLAHVPIPVGARSPVSVAAEILA